MMIGQKLKDARTALGLTQEAVAEQIQVSRQTISNWENGKFYPDIISVIKLSELYGLSLDELLKSDAAVLRHLDKSTNAVKSNRRLAAIGAVCLLLLFIFSLLAGGRGESLGSGNTDISVPPVSFANDRLSISGPAAVYAALFIILGAGVGLATYLAGLVKRKKASPDAPLREIIKITDIFRPLALAFFLICAFLILW